MITACVLGVPHSSSLACCLDNVAVPVVYHIEDHQYTEMNIQKDSHKGEYLKEMRENNGERERGSE